MPVRRFACLAPLAVVSALAVGCAPNAPDEGIGTAQAPVVGGRLATMADLEATVGLYDNEYSSQFCTGTLVGPRLVVTAAHCLEGADTRWVEVHAGDLDFNDQAPAPGIHAVTQLVPHPRFRQSAQPYEPDGLWDDNDIAVLVLATPVTAMEPVPILPLEDVDDVLTQGTPITVTGYGVNDMGTGAGGVLYTADTPYQRRVTGEFLAGGMAMPDTCNGDSGGPAYVEADGTTYLVGATSRAAANAQADCGDGGIYALVPHYVDWIDSYRSSPPPGPGDDPMDPPDPGPGDPPDDEPGEEEPPTPPAPPTPKASDQEASSGCSVGAGSNGRGFAPLLLALLALRRRRD